MKLFLVSEVLRYTGRLRKSNIRSLAFLAKVKACHPHGSEFEKAHNMFSAATDYILNESVANNVATFSVLAQSENVEPYRV